MRKYRAGAVVVVARPSKTHFGNEARARAGASVSEKMTPASRRDRPEPIRIINNNYSLEMSIQQQQQLLTSGDSPFSPVPGFSCDAGQCPHFVGGPVQALPNFQTTLRDHPHPASRPMTFGHFTSWHADDLGYYSGPRGRRRRRDDARMWPAWYFLQGIVAPGRRAKAVERACESSSRELM